MRTKLLLNRLIVALLLTPVSGSVALALPASAPERDSSEHCVITLDGIHYDITLLEALSPIPPIAAVSCGTAVKLSFEDQYFQLGCIASGFQGYFALSRWTAPKIKGDAGVDVTGAPNPILVEGANTASVMVAPESEASVQIAIPADGFVAFDWRHIGGSNFINQSFWIAINGERADGLRAGTPAGSFFYGPLEAGDVLGLHARTAGEGFAIELANFAFHTNAAAVVERRWKAVSAAAPEAAFFTQLVSVKKPNLSHVVFPGNYDGFEYPMLGWGESIHPEWTGYPVLDEDGLLSTTHDQHSLQGSQVPFTLSWEDEAMYDESGNLCTIFRDWTVMDECGDNIIVHTQFIKLQGACPEAPRPTQYDESEQAAPFWRSLKQAEDELGLTASRKAGLPDKEK